MYAMSAEYADILDFVRMKSTSITIDISRYNENKIVRACKQFGRKFRIDGIAGDDNWLRLTIKEGKIRHISYISNY